MAKRYYIVSFLFILSIFSLAYGINERHSPPCNKFDEVIVVEKIYDGDTIAAFVNGFFEKIRLIGIDAPEMNQRPWGGRAKECLKSLISATHQRVSMEYDVKRRDKYGRILAYIWTQDEKMINEEMIKKGCAVLFRVSPNIKYTERLRAAQEIAQQHSTGIWGGHGLQETPYTYRKKHPRR